MSGDTYSFSCKCGARLQARPDMAGKRGKCRKCGEGLVIPGPPAETPRVQDTGRMNTGGMTGGLTSPARQEKKSETCSICQTAIGPGEMSLSCDACHLPFHPDCWQANFGCATYGCKNVNVLKPGPDIAINQAALQQAPGAYASGSQQQAPGAYASGSQAAPPWQTQAAPTPAKKVDIPWEYLLLAASAIAGLVSCVTCGLPPLLVALVAAFYAHNNPQTANMPVLAAVWIVSVITFFLGIMVSMLMNIASV